MHIFKEYDDYGVEDELFHFVAAGNNRDRMHPPLLSDHPEGLHPKT